VAIYSTARTTSAPDAAQTLPFAGIVGQRRNADQFAEGPSPQAAQLRECRQQRHGRHRANAFDRLKQRTLVFEVLIDMPVHIAVDLADLFVQRPEHGADATCSLWRGLLQVVRVAEVGVVETGTGDDARSTGSHG
jgi:hypothetical protein